MFIIQDRHYEAISKNAEDEFTAKTLVFLKENQPEWCQAKTDQNICDYIKSVIEFARSFSIDEALAIQKLAFYKIELGFSLPPLIWPFLIFVIPTRLHTVANQG
jgi:hypothetical protein